MESKNVLSNFIWRFAERWGAQIVTFIVSIVLARLLTPDTYGTIALITVFINIVQIFVDSGLGNALIQKKDADNIDFSTVCYVNIFLCVGLYIVLFVTAPVIANFYRNIALIPMIRVLGLIIIVSGMKNVQQAYVSRHMLFKRFFFSTLGGTICAAIVGILLAYVGFGVWALIAQSLVNNIIDTFILWITVKWRPNLAFSKERFKILFGYGWKLMVSVLLDTVCNNFRILIIGRLCTSADLGVYNQGERFPKFLISNINSSIDSVLFPVMSNIQNDRDHIKNITRRSIMTSTYIMAPLMIGMFTVAEPLIKLLLTDKWLPCVPYLRIFCITYMFWPIHTANLNAIKAIGRSDLFLKLEIIKQFAGLILLIVSMHYGVMAIAYSTLIDSFICQLINSWPNRKLLSYGYIEQIRDILPSIIVSIIMGIVIYPIGVWVSNDILAIIIQILTGVTVYAGFSALLRIDSFQYLLNLAKSLIGKWGETT